MAGCPAPSYQEFALGLSFACEVTISRRAEPFGSRNAGFANKKAARLNAAQAAVLWLRENSLFDVGDGPARKKRKKSMSSSPGTASPMLEVKDRHFAQQVEGKSNTPPFRDHCLYHSYSRNLKPTSI
jgi:hypothetical protein